MSNPFETSGPPHPTRSHRRRTGWTVRITPAGILVLLLINLLILAGWIYGISRVMATPSILGNIFGNNNPPTPVVASRTSPPTTATGTATQQPTASSSPQASQTSLANPVMASPQPIGTLALNQGLIILALDEGGNSHLFAYQPEGTGAGAPLPLSRLTYGPWDDISPAISPDGRRVAFASNRNGYWDIYLMDLASAGLTRLTDTPEYDGAPSWSPDNLWLAYETYLNDNLEIKIHSINDPANTILLTDNAAADFSPAWSPQGRQIAFVSTRSSEAEIWLADLDKSADQRFVDLSQNPAGEDSHPAWSPDGTSIVWVSERDGIRNLQLSQLTPTGEANKVGMDSTNLGNGDWPAWSTDGESILTILQSPNRTYLTAYRTHYAGLVLPTIELPGSVYGLSWGDVALAAPLQEVYQQSIQATATPLYTQALSSVPQANGNRYQLSLLEGVQAPNPYLHDMVDESFRALRAKVSSEAGWDFLSNLDNAYVPLTSPLDPGMGDDWLYTGRAMAVNTMPVSAGWMVVVREDFGLETYWHIYIRPLYQDGSAGIPLHDQPWDFDARHNGDTIKYEQGGAKMTSIPPGYWIDFTVRAHAYGWERLPALTTWRASYPAARFNEFVQTGGLDWRTAMLELYPPESMITPSPVIPPTRTPTPTSRWYVSPTPTSTPTPRPTFTPSNAVPSNTPIPGGWFE